MKKVPHFQSLSLIGLKKPKKIVSPENYKCKKLIYLFQIVPGCPQLPGGCTEWRGVILYNKFLYCSIIQIFY